MNPRSKKNRRVRMHRNSFSARRLALAGLSIALILAATSSNRSQPVSSASVSGSLERLAVKNGVITIAPGQPQDSVMELGHEGQDIASTGLLYFRPNNTTAGTYFFKSADNTQNLLLTGNLRVSGGITLGGQRQTTWPGGDGWAVAAGNLTPQDPATSVELSAFGNSLRAFGNTSLASGFDTLRITNLSGAPAVDFGSAYVTVNDEVSVGGGAYVCMDPGNGCQAAAPQWRGQVWTTVNDGPQPDGTPDYSGGPDAGGAGPDADTIDGLNTYLVDDCGGKGGGVYCFCSINTYGSPTCILMWPN
ncbi:MAG: hypothetical protein HY421_01965 [Candidatus Kerfeldbacteria bacterium]|nr:hypothetical protein [Candidatus Kerfeldbacteria bacterium]